MTKPASNLSKMPKTGETPGFAKTDRERTIWEFSARPSTGFTTGMG